jgi:phosphoribosylamine---glycine ligase
MTKKRILVVGSGGREHAICWALHNTSKQPLDVYCAPGNAGIETCAELLPCAADDHKTLAEVVESEGIDLTFVGPEAPLAAGLVDTFVAAGLKIIGPTGDASRLEASKVFAKDFMSRHQIPTAAYRVAESATKAVDVIRSGEFGSADSQVVIKADGLAAGKGVVVASSRVEAEKAIEDLMVKQIAGPAAAQRVVIEEALSGKEVSLLLFSDGRDYVLMPPARDHKRIGEGDVGPNTGGMGSITDDSILDDAMLKRIVGEVVEPTIEGARREGFPFRGVLFLGLMLTAQGPKLLEYNVRFGDPETQAILIRLKTDLVSILQAIHDGELRNLNVEWQPGSSACVVAANRGYPGKYDSGAVIQGLETVDFETAVQIFHAGTSRSKDGRLIATGGRVLGVTAAAGNLNTALRLCYDSLERIRWEGMQYRRDIGSSALSGIAGLPA